MVTLGAGLCGGTKVWHRLLTTALQPPQPRWLPSALFSQGKPSTPARGPPHPPSVATARSGNTSGHHAHVDTRAIPPQALVRFLSSPNGLLHSALRPTAPPPPLLVNLPLPQGKTDAGAQGSLVFSPPKPPNSPTPPPEPPLLSPWPPGTCSGGSRPHTVWPRQGQQPCGWSSPRLPPLLPPAPHVDGSHQETRCAICV